MERDGKREAESMETPEPMSPDAERPQTSIANLCTRLKGWMRTEGIQAMALGLGARSRDSARPGRHQLGKARSQIFNAD